MGDHPRCHQALSSTTSICNKGPHLDLILHVGNLHLAGLDLLFQLLDLVVQHELELLQLLKCSTT